MSALRYFAACVAVLVGLFLLFASMVGGYGVHQRGDAVIALPFSLLGLVVCLSAYGLVRRGPIEPTFRKSLSALFVVLGSLQVMHIWQLVYRKITHVDSTEAWVLYDTTSYPFVFAFGGLCLVALYVLNVLLKPHPRTQNDANAGE